MSEKNLLWAKKPAFLAQKSAFFYATPMKPLFFWVRRTRLNGIISSPYPEVTLGTFGFPVGGRLAARRAVSWTQCIAWHRMVLRGIELYRMVLHSFACDCIVSYGIAWYRTWDMALSKQAVKFYQSNCPVNPIKIMFI